MQHASATRPSSEISSQATCPSTHSAIPHLGTRVTVRFATITPLVIALFFLPAGTLRWWQGWAFLAVYVGFAVAAFFFFLKADPQLVERRLQAKEPMREQKQIKLFGALVLSGIFTLPGFDHRLGWSRAWLGTEPTWLEILALAGVLGGEIAMAWVMWTNRYASRTIRVEQGQTVISSGPYRLVRHPMYAFSLVAFLFVPLALGSYVTVPALALFLPIYVLRILNEEKLLRAELHGYAEYCQRTRWRMVPLVW
jgi:protein-S-isoprenylcysteine O-methyltransferase Ste14